MRVLPGIPVAWPDLSCILPIHHAGRLHITVQEGRLAELRLEESQPDARKRLLVLPRRFLTGSEQWPGSARIVEETKETLTLRVVSRGTTIVLR